MSDVIYVGVQDFRGGYIKATCVGMWADREQAIKDISSEHNYDEEFSTPEDKSPFWGTTG